MRIRGGRRYRDLVRWLTKLYRFQMRRFIDSNLDSPLDLLVPDLARLAAIGGFGKLGPAIEKRLSDPRTRRVFSFQAMYAGLAPAQALAAYGVIAYMDTVAGVYFPTGGMHALPTALAGAATKHGVDLRLGTEVVEVERRADALLRCAPPAVTGGCDALVLTADLPVAWQTLLGETPRRIRRLRYSPSCCFLLAGSRTAFPDRVHHEIDFGASWDTTFEEIIDRGQVMSDPSFMVSIPSRSDPTLAPTGRHCLSVLFPAPNLTARQQDWATQAPAYLDHMLATLEARGWPGFNAGLEVSELATPADWAARGMAAGTPFAAAHTFGQTGPFRPRNLARGWDNVVFAGSGTTPGVGVPSVLISGRLAAERITGPDRRYRSRAWPS